MSKAASLAAWADRKAAALEAEAAALNAQAYSLRFQSSGGSYGRAADKARAVRNLQAQALERTLKAARLRERYPAAA